MFNVETIGESARRHWIVIILVTVICVGAGAFSSYRANSGEQAARSYMAEAVIYVQDYGYASDDRAGAGYNYSLSEGYMVNDARRIVMGNDVAGKIREAYKDDDITVSSPLWRDTERNENIDTRFVFVDVSASDADTAKEAANAAAALAVEKIEATLPVESAEISEAAYLRPDSGYAAEPGTDAIVEDEGDAPVTSVAARSISFKTVFVYGFVGLVLSVAVFAAYDILTRRVRSARDVERLLDIPVVETVRASCDTVRLASSVSALMARNGFSSMCVVGASADDGADDLARKLASALPDCKIGSVSFSEDEDGVLEVREYDAVLVVLRRAASRGSAIDAMMWRLRIADVPVIGSAFLDVRR